ncbi:hypothetical protein N665_0029s0114 [Sinapis alba]|nr:hypothetical protein N665_0029s0114 [Sinapis alba]
MVGPPFRRRTFLSVVGRLLTPRVCQLFRCSRWHLAPRLASLRGGDGGLLRVYSGFCLILASSSFYVSIGSLFV